MSHFPPMPRQMKNQGSKPGGDSCQCECRCKLIDAQQAITSQSSLGSLRILWICTKPYQTYSTEPLFYWFSPTLVLIARIREMSTAHASNLCLYIYFDLYITSLFPPRQQQVFVVVLH